MDIDNPNSRKIDGALKWLLGGLAAMAATAIAENLYDKFVVDRREPKIDV